MPSSLSVQHTWIVIACMFWREDVTSHSGKCRMNFTGDFGCSKARSYIYHLGGLLIRSDDGAIVPAHNGHGLQGGLVLAAFACEPGLQSVLVLAAIPSVSGTSDPSSGRGGLVDPPHVATRSGSF